MSSAVAYLRDQVVGSSRIQEADSYFRPVDWKWVLRHTFIENPFASAPKPWKERLSVSSFGEDLMDDTESFQSQLERNLQERVIDMFEHKYYELVITSTALTFLTCLLGMLLNTPLPPKPRSDAILVLEGTYIILFAAEITTMITAYGHRFVRLDNYNKLDLVLVATCIFVFVVQFTIYFFVPAQYQHQAIPTAIFILAVSVRLVHAVKYIELVQDWLLEVLHRYLDKVIYAAYETSLAIITGEEEVQQNVWNTVKPADLALDVRSRATNNRLIVLRNLVEIQSRFPGIAVAFKSRQAAQTILNDVAAHVAEMQRDGFFTEEQHRELYQMLKDKMMGIICAPNGLPASYKPIAVLRVIPWIGSDSVRQFLAVEGEVEYREDGALPNSSSALFFFSDEYFEDYLGAPVTLGTLGLVTDEPSATRASTETAVNTWPMEKIKMRLSSFLLPDLASAHDFLVSPDIEDILLIQGTLVDFNTGDVYAAPYYIPRFVKRFIFPGDFSTRPRPVIAVVANKQYKLPLEFDWLRRVPTEEERLAEMEASRRGDIGREYKYLTRRRNTDQDF
ncbi:hypothetical protein V5799_017410 [Amblyomma americanum]|uniref:Uncharacterized protein n=1 Tax=Amblyomma americanum TaxID=6943 RepID=A0AAQ4F2U4_AMBAM